MINYVSKDVTYLKEEKTFQNGGKTFQNQQDMFLIVPFWNALHYFWNVFFSYKRSFNFPERVFKRCFSFGKFFTGLLEYWRLEAGCGNYVKEKIKTA